MKGHSLSCLLHAYARRPSKVHEQASEAKAAYTRAWHGGVAQVFYSQVPCNNKRMTERMTFKKQNFKDSVGAWHTGTAGRRAG